MTKPETTTASPTMVRRLALYGLGGRALAVVVGLLVALTDLPLWLPLSASALVAGAGGLWVWSARGGGRRARARR